MTPEYEFYIKNKISALLTRKGKIENDDAEYIKIIAEKKEYLNSISKITNKKINTGIQKVFEPIFVFENPVNSWINKANEKLASKPIENTMTLFDNEFIRLNLKSYMVTVTYNASIVYMDGWARVQEDLNKVTEVLFLSEEPINFLCSVIEHNHTIPSNRGKVPKKEEEEEEEIKTSKKKKAKSSKEFKTYSPLHWYQTLDEFEQHISDKIREEKYMNEINEIYLTECILNFITERIYTKNTNKMDNDLIEYLQEQQNVFYELTKVGKPYKFNKITDPKSNKKLYVIDKWLYIGLYQDKYGLTTIGSPHFHIVFYTRYHSDKTTFRSNILRLLKNTIGVTDIALDPSTCDPPKPTTPMMYIFKNHSCNVVANALKNYSKSHQEEAEVQISKEDEDEDEEAEVKTYIVKHLPTTLVRCIVNEADPQFNSIFFRMLKEISDYGCDGLKQDTISGNVFSYNKTIALTVDKVNIPLFEESGSALYSMPIKMEAPKKLNPDRYQGKYKFLYDIVDYMEEHNYVICEKMIYVYREGSKSSFKPYSTIDDFITGLSKNVIYIYKNLKDVKLWMENEIVHELKNSDGQIVDFPRIKINYRIVEFGDFYFSFLTRKIYKTQNKYYTYLYCPEITLENLNKSIGDLIEHSVWIQMLKHSQLYTIDDIGILYELTLNRKNNKNATIVIIGHSNTYKSNIIRIFEYMYPKHLVGYLQKFSEYHVNDMMKGKLIVIINEGNELLRSVNDKGARGPVLSILGGETGIANKKFGDITDFNFAEHSLVLTNNIEIEDKEVFKSETTLNRVRLCLTRPLNDNSRYVYEAAAAKCEAPLILLFAAMCNISLINSINFIPQLIVEELPTDIDYELIDFSDIFDGDQEIELKHDDITGFSKKCKAETTINFTPFDNENLPSRSFLTFQEKKVRISSIIRKQELDKYRIQKKEQNEFYDNYKNYQQESEEDEFKTDHKANFHKDKNNQINETTLIQ